MIDFQTLRILYHGTDQLEATAAGTSRSYTASDERYGPSLRKAAMAAGYLRRGEPVPELEPREEDLGD